MKKGESEKKSHVWVSKAKLIRALHGVLITAVNVFSRHGFVTIIINVICPLLIATLTSNYSRRL